MNLLTDLNYLKSLFQRHGLKPKDYLGQNFLIDEAALKAIIAAADLKTSDTVLEVGPGAGTLTVELVSRAGKVVAVEKDEQILKIQDVEDAPPQNKDSPLMLINQDILKFNLDQHITGPYKVVANIPYYLTSHLIKYFLEQKNQPQLLVLMVQKEVGERIVAKPGQLSVLGISVQFFADAEIMAGVPKTSFWPVPEVDSVIIKIIPRVKYSEIKEHASFFRLIKQAFAGKRKQIKNTIKNPAALRQAGIAPAARPQELSIDDWVRLYQAINS